MTHRRTPSILVLSVFVSLGCDFREELITDTGLGSMDPGVLDADLGPLTDGSITSDSDATEGGPSEDSSVAPDGGALDSGGADVDLPDTGVDIRGLPSGGQVMLFLQYGEGYDARYGSAEFYSSYSIGGGAEPPNPPLEGPRTRDECEVLGGSENAGQVAFEYADMGPQIAVLAADVMHVFERRVEGEELWYEYHEFPYLDGPWTGGKISLQIPGAAREEERFYSDVIDAPATRFDLVGTSTIITTPTGADIPLEFTWTPDANAQEVTFNILEIQQNQRRLLCSCRVVDDGRFVVPPACVERASWVRLTVHPNHEFIHDVPFDGRRFRVWIRVNAQIDFARVID